MSYSNVVSITSRLPSGHKSAFRSPSLCEFTSDTVVQVLAKGLLIGKHAYLKSGWNIMDGFLVFISLVDIAFLMVSKAQSPRIFGILRVFRLLRTLRPLRYVHVTRSLLSYLS